MKKVNILRIVIYLGLMAAFVFYIQIEKQKVVESRAREAVTLIGEKMEHGTPVDVQEVRYRSLPETLRVSVTELDSESKTLTFYFDRSQKTKLRQGQEVLSTNEDKTVGEVSSLSNRISASLGLYKGKIKLSDKSDTSDLKLKSLDVVVGTKRKSLAVPMTAVQYDRMEGPYVWISDSGIAKKQKVDIGQNYNLESEITSGVEEGTRVVINGAKKLEAGEKLRVRRCVDCAGVVKND